MICRGNLSFASGCGRAVGAFFEPDIWGSRSKCLPFVTWNHYYMGNKALPMERTSCGGRFNRRNRVLEFLGKKYDRINLVDMILNGELKPVDPVHPSKNRIQKDNSVLIWDQR